MSKLNNFC
jgi:hypothetical protein